MNTIDEKTRSVAMLISNVLFRAALLGFGLVALTSIPVLLMTDQIYALHNSIIAIARPDYNVLMFGWLGTMKLAVLVLFLTPAIAIRWSLKKA
jgi:hypothetical protein